MTNHNKLHPKIDKLQLWTNKHIWDRPDPSHFIKRITFKQQYSFAPQTSSKTYSNQIYDQLQQEERRKKLRNMSENEINLQAST